VLHEDSPSGVYHSVLSKKGVDDLDSSFFHLYVVIHIVILGDLPEHERVVLSQKGGGPKMADKRSSTMPMEM